MALQARFTLSLLSLINKLKPLFLDYLQKALVSFKIVPIMRLSCQGALSNKRCSNHWQGGVTGCF